MFVISLSSCDERTRNEIIDELEYEFGIHIPEMPNMPDVSDMVDSVRDTTGSLIQTTIDVISGDDAQPRRWWENVTNFFGRDRTDVEQITIPDTGGVYFTRAFDTIYIPRTVAEDIFRAVNTRSIYEPIVQAGLVHGAERILEGLGIAKGWGFIFTAIIVADDVFNRIRINSFVEAIENVEENGFITIMIMTDALTGGHPRPEWYVNWFNSNTFESSRRGTFTPLEDLTDNEWLELLSRMGITRNVSR